MRSIREIRWKIEDLLSRIPGRMSRRVVVGVAVVSVALVVVAVVYVAVGVARLGSGSSGPLVEVAEFRDRVEEAVVSEEGKSDLAGLNGLGDAALRREVKARMERLNAISREGRVETEEGRAAWGALLRATQVNEARMRLRPSNDD